MTGLPSSRHCRRAEDNAPKAADKLSVLRNRRRRRRRRAGPCHAVERAPDLCLLGLAELLIEALVDNRALPGCDRERVYSAARHDPALWCSSVKPVLMEEQQQR